MVLKFLLYMKIHKFNKQKLFPIIPKQGYPIPGLEFPMLCHTPRDTYTAF